MTAKLWEGEDGGVDGNIMRLRLYRPDDEKFLLHAENFMKVPTNLHLSKAPTVHLSRRPCLNRNDARNSIAQYGLIKMHGATGLCG